MSLPIVKFKRRVGENIADVYFGKIHLSFYIFLNKCKKSNKNYAIFNVCFLGYNDISLDTKKTNYINMYYMSKIMYFVNTTPMLFDRNYLHKYDNDEIISTPYSIFLIKIL
jgi:hypothetical protein